MLLTFATAVTLTVAITAYAASRGRSPVAWGGASVLVFAVAILLAWLGVANLGTTDAVFDRHGAALGMLVALVGPVVAIIGNGALASRLISLPRVRPERGSDWRMWRLGNEDSEGGECRLSVRPDRIVGLQGYNEWFSIPHDQVVAVEVDGETLRLRSAGGLELRLILADGDPDHRDARVAEIVGLKRQIERRRSLGRR